MMKTLNEMNEYQRTYLKQKWSAEVVELDRDIFRAEERLSNRLERQVLDQAQIDVLEENLIKAQALLTHLTDTSAPQEMIDNQQELVNTIQTDIDNESRGSNVLTDTEAYLQQASIDQLRLQKEYREGKITEIETIAEAVDTLS